MKSSCLIAFVFISTIGCAQNPEIDSLQKILKAVGEEKQKVSTLNNISDAYYKIGDYNSSIEFGRKALVLSEKLNLKREQFNSLESLIQVYSVNGNYPAFLKNSFSCMKLAEDLGEKDFISRAYQHMGGAYLAMNNNEEALKYYNACLKIRKEMKHYAAIAQTYNSIGGIYSGAGNYPEALSNFTKALDVFQGMGESRPYWALGWTYHSIADVHLRLGEAANKAGRKTEAQNEFSDALKNSLIALEAQQRQDFMPGIIEGRLQAGVIYMYLKEYSLSAKYLERSLELAISTDDTSHYPELYHNLSTLDSIRGDYKRAFQNYKLSVFYQESLDNEKSRKESIRNQMQYEFDKKESVILAEQEKKDILTNGEISKQKLIRNFSIGGAFAFVFFGGFVFYNFRKRKKLEGEKALADERLRISRDLHDDLGASLSSISVFSSAVKQKLMNNEKQGAEQLLDRMSTDAQEMVSGMSEMVWTISPHNDTVEKLAERLQVYAAGMLSAKNISFKLEYDEELKDKKLTVDFRKNIFLILKEAINNAAKYSYAREVKLSFSKNENRFVVVLADNGKGFDISTGKTGNGLRNMQQRADVIQSYLIVSSEINMGTSVILECVMV
jgi:two-component system sensor histidine kinase UhpB